MQKINKALLKNTIYLYVLNFTKLILPLLTLPYLTRVLTTEYYGVVTYVKACMSYMQLIIDFGFVLSATKEIVEIGIENKNKIGRIVGDTIAAKSILSVGSAVVLFILTTTVPILKNNTLFTWLYFVSIVLTIFLTDFLFRGLERMEMVTLPYVITKTISTVLTIVFVKSESAIILLPIFEILGTLLAVLVIAYFTFKLNINLSFSNLRSCINKIKTSFVYFISNFATTGFNVLNTLIVGIYLSATDVAYWGLCLQLVTAVQNMYTPITNSLYPQMIQHKNKQLIKKILIIFMPIITLGCLFCLIYGEWIVRVVGGEKYVPAAIIFRLLVPILFVGFPAILFGWPVLGAINKEKETSFSTITAAVTQVILLLILGFVGKFSLVNLAIARCLSEFVLFSIRYYYFRKNIKLFN